MSLRARHDGILQIATGRNAACRHALLATCAAGIIATALGCARSDLGPLDVHRAFDGAPAPADSDNNTGGDQGQPPRAWFPDTGQRRCFSDTGVIPCPGTVHSPTCASTPYCGQDAQLGWDTQHLASERFVRSTMTLSEPIVEDTLIDLVWHGCSAGLMGADCSSGSQLSVNWDAAMLYCENSTWASEDDWRLPTVLEVASILDFGGSFPVISPSAFPGHSTGQHWTSTTHATVPTDAWEVLFTYGRAFYVGKVASLEFSCVRGTGLIQLGRFNRSELVATEPVVHDVATGRMWQGCVAGLRGPLCETGTTAENTWRDALSYCQALAWGGFDDWYLPNVLEIYALTHYDSIDPAIDTGAFPGVSAGPRTWASSTHPIEFTRAWYGRFTDGGVNAFDRKTETGHVRCIRLSR